MFDLSKQFENPNLNWSAAADGSEASPDIEVVRDRSPLNLAYIKDAPGEASQEEAPALAAGGSGAVRGEEVLGNC